MSVEKNLEIKARATFKMTVKLRDRDGDVIDIDGYTAKAEIRADYKDEVPLAVFSVEVDEVNDTLTLILPPPESSKLNELKSGKIAVWDLFIISPSGFRSKVLYGTVFVEKAATSL